MNRGKRKLWPLAVRKEAIRMLEAGYGQQEISRKLGVPEKTINTWGHKFAVERGASRPLDKSGVIAPPAYRYGYRWGAGWF